MILNETIQEFINTISSKIEGWFFPFDMITFVQINNIQENIGIKGIISEVGVYKAKSFVLLSHLINHEEKLIGFDLFPEELESEARLIINQYGANVNYELIKTNTSELTTDKLYDILNGKLRLLHIDAGHEYHEVLHQLLIFGQYMTDGGVIIMDDYQDREFPGIEAAVLDFCEIDRPRRFVPFYSGANKIYLCETNYALTYQEMLLSTDGVRNNSRITKVRDFYILIGGSKLPMEGKKILDILNRDSFPKKYLLNEQSISKLANRYNQIKHM